VNGGQLKRLASIFIKIWKIMHIYLKHPRHGTKIATLEMEAAFDEEHGWVRYNPQEIEEVEEEQPDPVVNQLQVKRRGRPPKMAA
jgi:hypothetical protein|tara:strand:- start:695 stop:949 length:255 start_codon:yes stop_codon:yes gene_type:complete